MIVASSELTAELPDLGRIYLTAAAYALGECLPGEGIHLAAPVFGPVEIGVFRSLAGDDDLGDEHRIVAEGRIDCLIDGEVCSLDLFAEVAHSEEAFEASAVA